MCNVCDGVACVIVQSGYACPIVRHPPRRVSAMKDSPYVYQVCIRRVIGDAYKTAPRFVRTLLCAGSSPSAAPECIPRRFKLSLLHQHTSVEGVALSVFRACAGTTRVISASRPAKCSEIASNTGI